MINCKRCGQLVEKDHRCIASVLGGYQLDMDNRGKLVTSIVDTNSTKDYGADPLGNGLFKMIPSGDVVDFEERNRRLS